MEREIGSGSLPACLLKCRIRGVEVEVVVEVEREIGSGGLPECLLYSNVEFGM